MSRPSIQGKILRRMIGNQQPKELRKSEDEAQCWAQEEWIEKHTPKPWEDKKDYEAIFRKFKSIGEDGEEHYDMIYKEIREQ